MAKMHEGALHLISPCWMPCWMENQGGEKKTGSVEDGQHTEGLRTVQTSLPSSDLEDRANGSTFLCP